MRFSLTPVVTNLLILNFLVLIATSIIPINLNDILGLHYIESSKFFPTQFFTYMFAHSGFPHLLGNMLGLVFFGVMLERVWGSQRFLLFYIITGLGAAAIYMGAQAYEIYSLKAEALTYLKHPSAEGFNSFIADNVRNIYSALYDFIEKFLDSPDNPAYIAQSKSYVKEILNLYVEGPPMVGASGAVLAVVIGYALLFPNNELFLIPIKVKYLALMYLAKDILGIIESSPEDNIAHFAHLGGMIFAFILVQYWKTRRDTFY